MKILPLLKRRCPRCSEGALFRGWFQMNDTCPKCKMNFEREEGYYTGAMFINWFLAIFIIGPVWIGMIFAGYPFGLILGTTVFLLILSIPVFFQYSRVIWLYIDFFVFHPE